jgi:hypothetical protein
VDGFEEKSWRDSCFFWSARHVAAVLLSKMEIVDQSCSVVAKV